MKLINKQSSSYAAVLLYIGSLLFFSETCFSQIISNLPQDSTQKKVRDSIQSKGEIPGPSGVKEFFTAQQEENFRNALRIRIPLTARLDYDILTSRNEWDNYFNNLKPDPIAVARNNLLNYMYYASQPSDNDIVQHQIDIENSLAVPGIKTMMKGGLQVPFGAIASIFGLTEDVSPEISYTIDDFTYIEVVVYSTQAVVVTTLFKGNQPPDSYTLRWNGKDDEGRRLAPGDYIMEVRVGNEKYIRKRIVIQ